MNRDEIIQKLDARYHALAEDIKNGKIQASIPVLMELCNLSYEELEKVYNAAIGCGNYCRIYCNSDGNGVPGENIMIKAAGRRAAKKIYPLMPIKQMPAYDPDAEIISLTLTIPSWIDSIKRKCHSVSLENNSSRAIEGLIAALSKLSNECNMIIDTVRRSEERHE